MAKRFASRRRFQRHPQHRGAAQRASAVSDAFTVTAKIAAALSSCATAACAAKYRGLA